MAAPRHAFAAFDAAGTVRADAAEVRVRDSPPGFTEVHTHRCLDERVADAHVVGNFLDHSVRRGHSVVLHDAEHASRLVVERTQFVVPVGDLRPLLVLEERGRRLVQRVGIVERSTADARSREDQAVAKEVDPLNTETSELRRPEESLQIPAGLGEVRVGESATGLENTDLVSLFHQPQCGDTATETRTDDQNVVVRDLLSTHRSTSAEPALLPASMHSPTVTTHTRASSLLRRVAETAGHSIQKWPDATSVHYNAHIVTSGHNVTADRVRLAPTTRPSGIP